MSNFDRWNEAFRINNFYEFNNNPNGLLWLKVRAVSRRAQLKSFLDSNGLTLSSKNMADKQKELFELMENDVSAMSTLDKYLRDKNNEFYSMMGVDVEKLKLDLYKVKYYNWGGNRNNSLDKHLVDRFVKVISEYDVLISNRDRIADNAWNYVQNSWYNNWTTYLIESLFKHHEKVVSAVGEIKNVDFFINDYPIDLKVTFFPNKFLDEKIKLLLGKKELSWLKSKGKSLGITANANDTEPQQIYTIVEKLREIGHNEVIAELNEAKRAIVEESQKDPIELMTWLYENQGEMRFGAENRLFIILADSNDLSMSWKMKRAFSLIEPKVQNYLSEFSDQSLKTINFSFKNQKYKSLSDVIFVIQ